MANGNGNGTPTQQEPKLAKVYDYLKKNGKVKAPTYEEFEQKMSDPAKLEKVYNYLKQNNKVRSENFETFRTAMAPAPPQQQPVNYLEQPQGGIKVKPEAEAAALQVPQVQTTPANAAAEELSTIVENPSEALQNSIGALLNNEREPKDLDEVRFLNQMDAQILARREKRNEEIQAEHEKQLRESEPEFIGRKQAIESLSPPGLSGIAEFAVTLGQTIQSGIADQLPKEYYVQRLRMSKGNFGDLFDPRSNVSAFGKELPAGISRDEFALWNNKQPSSVRYKSYDDKARLFLTEKLGAEGYEKLKNQFSVENAFERRMFEKDIQTQNIEAKAKTVGVVQNLKEVNGASDFLNFAGNMIGQALYRAPTSLLTGTAGSIVAESAAVYDRQLDLLAEKHGISREEVIKRGLDEPAAGQALAVVLGTMDAVSEFNLIGLFRKAAGKELTESAVKQFIKGFTKSGGVEATTETIQSEGEEFAAAKGAGVDYDFDAWRAATSFAGGYLGGGPIGGLTNIQKAKVQPTATPKEAEEEPITKPTDEKPIEEVPEPVQEKGAAETTTATKPATTTAEPTATKTTAAGTATTQEEVGEPTEYTLSITPATVRKFDALTTELKDKSDQYSTLDKQLIENAESMTDEEFGTLQKQRDAIGQEVLKKGRSMLQPEIESIEGVKIQRFGDLKGRWDGKSEPSFDLVVSAPQSSLPALRLKLADFAEKTSQDAFFITKPLKDAELQEIPKVDLINGKTKNGATSMPTHRLMPARALSEREKAVTSGVLEKKGINNYSLSPDGSVEVMYFDEKKKQAIN